MKHKQLYLSFLAGFNLSIPNRLPWEQFGVSSGSCCIAAQLCGGGGVGWGGVSNAGNKAALPHLSLITVLLRFLQGAPMFMT